MDSSLRFCRWRHVTSGYITCPQRQTVVVVVMLMVSGQVSYVRGSGGVGVNLLGSFPLDLQIVIQHLCSRWIRPSFLSKNRMCHLAWAPSSRVNATACKQPEVAWVILERRFPEDGRFRATAKTNSTFCNMTFCRFYETMQNHCTGYCFILFLRYMTYKVSINHAGKGERTCSQGQPESIIMIRRKNDEETV